MHPISDSDRRAIEAAIREAEQKTTAEFVAVVARRADRHHGVSLWAGLIAALAAALLIAWRDPWLSVLTAVSVQCVVFGVVYALFELTPLSARLATRRMRAAKARRLARLLFFERGLSGLPKHDGVLLLVALAERQVEIVADRGIDALAGGAEWQRVIDAFSARARSGQIAKALEDAIRDLGAILARHSPAEPGGRDQVPDRLIEL